MRRSPLLSIAVAFVLFGLLQGLNAGFDKAIREARLDGLTTNPRVPGGPPMPVSVLEQIERMPGVLTAAQRTTFHGWWKEPKNLIALLATDPPKWFAVRPGFAISEADRAAFMKTRMGMIATPAMLKVFGWKIGQRIPFKSQMLKQDGSGGWAFELVGTFDLTGKPNDITLAMIRFDYLDGARAMDRGTADQFMIRLSDPHRSVQTALAIDRLFANSAHDDGRVVSTVGDTVGNNPQLVYALSVTPALMATGVGLAGVIGLAGGLFPAVRAARMAVAVALRAR